MIQCTKEGHSHLHLSAWQRWIQHCVLCRVLFLFFIQHMQVQKTDTKSSKLIQYPTFKLGLIVIAAASSQLNFCCTNSDLHIHFILNEVWLTVLGVSRCAGWIWLEGQKLSRSWIMFLHVESTYAALAPSGNHVGRKLTQERQCPSG